MSIRIDGKQISAQIKDELKERVKKEKLEVTLAVIQVGNDPASTVYVGNKKKACEYIGIHSLAYELPEETPEEDSGTASLAGSYGRRQSDPDDLTEKRCRWISSTECRCTQHWAAGIHFLYTGGGDSVAKTYRC